MSGAQPYAPYSVLVDKYRFLTRTYIRLNGAGATSVPVNSILGQNFQLGTLTIGQTQALRLLKNLTAANCRDVSGTIFLSCIALNIVVTDSVGNNLAFIPGNYSGQRMGPQAGVTAVATGDEVLQFADLLPYQNDRTSFLFFLQADVQNFDGVAAHSFIASAQIYAELWEEKGGTGLRGSS